MNEAAFDLGDRPFVDTTIHALEAKLPSGEALDVFVHRRPLEGARSLRSLVDESIALNETRLAAYAVLEDVATTVGGLPGFCLRTRWRNAGTTFLQRQAHVAVDEHVMIFAVSAPESVSAACDEAFEGLLASLAWRAPTAAAAP